jgi:hypothetical protein
MSVQYRVRKQFKYGGKVLQPGEEFVPTGGKFDAVIVKQGVLVETVDQRIKTRKFNSGSAKEIIPEIQKVIKPKKRGRPKKEE